MDTNKSLVKYTIGLTLVRGFLLLIPLIAMQFTEEVVWTLSNFIFMGTLIFGVGLTYKLITRTQSHQKISSRKDWWFSIP